MNLQISKKIDNVKLMIELNDDWSSISDMISSVIFTTVDNKYSEVTQIW